MLVYVHAMMYLVVYVRVADGGWSSEPNKTTTRTPTTSGRAATGNPASPSAIIIRSRHGPTRRVRLPPLPPPCTQRRRAETVFPFQQVFSPS